MEGIDSNIYTITSQDLDDAFSRLESETIVMIFDSCFTGSFTELINPLSKPGRIIISACNAIELSSSSNELMNGIFTYYFSNALDFGEGLTDADKNNDTILINHSRKFQTNNGSTVTGQSNKNVMGYRVQIGAFENKDNAEKLQKTASSKFDFPVYIEYQAPFFRVRMGNFKEKSEAEIYIRLLKYEGFSDARWVPSYINIQ